MKRESSFMEITDASFIPANGKHWPAKTERASSLSPILNRLSGLTSSLGCETASSGKAPPMGLPGEGKSSVLWGCSQQAPTGWGKDLATMYLWLESWGIWDWRRGLSRGLLLKIPAMLSVCAWRNPMDRGASWAVVYGSQKQCKSLLTVMLHLAFLFTVEFLGICSVFQESQETHVPCPDLIQFLIPTL